MSSQRKAFWEAFLTTFLIFAIGIVLGIMLENLRTGKTDEVYQLSELNLMDIRIQNDIYSQGNFNCGDALKEIVSFADDVYANAKQLERYEGASKLTDTITFQHKKYDLLRTMLWLNSIKIKEQCNSTFSTLVYFYEYETQDLSIKAKQGVFSNILEEVKVKYGNEIILIPIAGNLDIKAINLLEEQYNIAQLPAILIDEKTKVTEVKSTEDIEKLL